MDLVRDIRAAPRAGTVQLLALLCLALLVICVGLALAWRDQRQEAACWRAAFEDDEIPAAGRCD